MEQKSCYWCVVGAILIIILALTGSYTVGRVVSLQLPLAKLSPLPSIEIHFPAADTAEVVWGPCSVILNPRKKTSYTYCTEEKK